MAYDNNNIFAKILRHEIPSFFIYEDTYVVAFYDIHPRAATHVLVVPKKAYTDYNDFITRATQDEIVNILTDVKKVADFLGLIDGGYRIVVNVGAGAGQEVPHLHFHILSDQKTSRH